MLARLKRFFKDWSLVNVISVFGGVGGLLGGIVGVIGMYYSREALEVSRRGQDTALAAQKTSAEAMALSQKSYDRDAGKVTAKLKVLEGLLADGFIPEPLMYHISGSEVVRLQKPQHMQMLNPRMVIENTGDEPIDAVRLECNVPFFASKFFKSEPLAEFKALRSWRNDQLTTEDYLLPGKLNTGDRAVVPVSRVILTQLARIQDPTLPDSNHHGVFEVKCYGRLVGGTAYDRADSSAYGIPVDLLWIPKGFSPDEVKRHLESDKPVVAMRRRK